MENQTPISLPSVQVTYRIFLRDMFPGWIFTIGLIYIFAPDIFQKEIPVIILFITAFIWSPITGLLVNILGYMFLQRVVKNRSLNRVIEFVFKQNTNRRIEYSNKIYELVFGSGDLQKRGKKRVANSKIDDINFMEGRSHFLLRASGWSGRDELVERVHGVFQSSRSLAFLSFIAILPFYSHTIKFRQVEIYGWLFFFLLGILFLIISSFLHHYSKLVDIQLLYELITTGQISVSTMRGEISESKKKSKSY